MYMYMYINYNVQAITLCVYSHLLGLHMYCTWLNRKMEIPSALIEKLTHACNLYEYPFYSLVCMQPVHGIHVQRVHVKCTLDLDCSDYTRRDYEAKNLTFPVGLLALGRDSEIQNRKRSNHIKPDHTYTVHTYMLFVCVDRHMHQGCTTHAQRKKFLLNSIYMYVYNVYLHEISML